jgi:hypothetical protein
MGRSLFKVPERKAGPGERERENSDLPRAREEGRMKRKSCSWREFSSVFQGVNKRVP